MIGCEDGFAVELTGEPEGAYTVEVKVAGEQPRVQECPADGGCRRLFFAGLVPTEATVVVVTAGGRTSHTLRPEVTTVQPNGPGCPPTCRQARASIPWPG
jgi:hypothetical protein